MSLKDIYNFLPLTDRLSSSGMPTQEQLMDLSKAGMEVVINLAMPTSGKALPDKQVGRPGIYDLEMRGRVNGVEKSHGNFKDMYWSFGDLIARSSENVMLLSGDVIGSGTVGTGCLLELTKSQGPWLNQGDVVEMEIERIGVLRNTVGRKMQR
jgi:2-keto-4-pentenoate hydratase/2-oxohepta-3-ene-1,7-dioic acid hydratase in catechol pathway